MRMRRWYVVLAALAVIAVAWGIGARLFWTQKTAEPNSPVAAVSFAYYTNSKGQTWALQSGDAKFTVASKETYPKFVLGTIDPVKVSIGDTQTMQIVIRDNVPLTKVWAEVEHDNGLDSIPLALGASSTVSYQNIQSEKYLVNGNGVLVVNSGGQPNGPVTKLVQALFKQASAENAVDYSYSGSWVVHDTATITYHTTFYAEDAQGRTDKLVLAWSDPCDLVDGALQSICTLTSATDGTDATSTNLNGQTLNINAGGLYAVNPGYSVIIGNGKIAFGGGTLRTDQFLYYPDVDADGYPSASTKTADSSSSLANYTRVSQAVGTTNPTLDCDDQSGYAKPSDATYYADPIRTNSPGDTSAWSINYPYGYSCHTTIVGGLNTPPGTQKGWTTVYNTVYTCNWNGTSWTSCVSSVSASAPGSCGLTYSAPNACNAGLVNGYAYGYFNVNKNGSTDRTGCLGGDVQYICK